MDPLHLAIGGFEGKLMIMDIETQKVFYEYQGHKGIINCIDGVAGLNIGRGAPEIVTGGRDGCVRVWGLC